MELRNTSILVLSIECAWARLRNTCVRPFEQNSVSFWLSRKELCFASRLFRRSKSLESLFLKLSPNALARMEDVAFIIFTLQQLLSSGRNERHVSNVSRPKFTAISYIIKVRAWWELVQLKATDLEWIRLCVCVYCLVKCVCAVCLCEIPHASEGIKFAQLCHKLGLRTKWAH